MWKYFFFAICWLISIALSAAPEPLSVDQAFRFSAAAKNNETLVGMWRIAPKYYLYQKSISFSAVEPTEAQLGMPLLPPSKKTALYPGVGKFAIYQNQLTVAVPVTTTQKSILVRAHYQGCSSNGYCYPPVTKIVKINLAGNYMTSTEPLSVNVATQPTPLHSNTENNLSYWLAHKHFIEVLLIFFGFGVLVSVTPCILPMVPILSAIIIGQKQPIRHGRSFLLSFIYVFFMALANAAIGVIFAWAGTGAQAYLQRPWVISVYALIFVLMALSLFGLYHVQLPHRLANYFNRITQQQKHTYFGTAIMGALSTLILSPCATPLLVSAILLISQTQQIWIGSILLFAMGMGMGLPLLLIGIAGPKLLPKKGPWMVSIQHFLGVLMLAVAIIMLSRIIPGAVTLLLWAILSIGCSIALGTFSSSTHRWQWIKKSIGIFLFIYGLISMIGALSGNTNPFKPLGFFVSSAQENSLSFTPVSSIADLKKQLKIAARLQKRVVLDFYADWCLACKVMEATTLTDPNVKQALKNYILLRADVTQNTEENKLLQASFNVIAPPTFLFFDTQGEEIPTMRIVGERSAQALLRLLQHAP